MSAGCGNLWQGGGGGADNCPKKAWRNYWLPPPNSCFSFSDLELPQLHEFHTNIALTPAVSAETSDIYSTWPSYKTFGVVLRPKFTAAGVNHYLYRKNVFCLASYFVDSATDISDLLWYFFQELGKAGSWGSQLTLTLKFEAGVRNCNGTKLKGGCAPDPSRKSPPAFPPLHGSPLPSFTTPVAWNR